VVFIPILEIGIKEALGSGISNEELGS